jgi:hypothetical protein
MEYIRDRFKSINYIIQILSMGKMFPKDYYYVNNAIRTVWHMLSNEENLIIGLREEIQCIRAELHELTEGAQAKTMTEPHILLGERSGVTDLFHHAAGKLLSYYCGSWDFNGGDEPQRLWDGIVAASNTSFDWWIRPEFQLLRLPLEFKMHTHRRLLPLAHEACHQIVHCVMRDSRESAAAGKLLSLWQRATEIAIGELETLRSLLQEARKAAGDPFKEWLDEALGKTRDLSRKMWDGTLEHARIENSELLVDLLSFLGGGPAAVTTLFELHYRPVDSHKHFHPPMWLRVFIGEMVFQYLGVTPKNNPWLHSSAWSLHVFGEQRFGDRPVFEQVKSQEAGFSGGHEALCRYITDGLPATEKETHELLAVGRTSDALVYEKIYYARAFLMQGSDLLTDLVRWCAEFSKDFLFYPANENGLFSSAEIDEVNHRCLRTAVRILYDEEVILDEDPRVIAAASMHPMLRRPVHPTGRIIHSLYYSTR